MSSLRNAVKRITHKERSQPRARQHLGILEKKKDFVVRAKHHHTRTKQLATLREKAAQRNPDEFYFGMQRNQVINGKHTKTFEARNEELGHLIGHDAVRIMKDQDLSYIRMQIQKDQSQIQKLETNLHFLGGGGGSGNTNNNNTANNREEDEDIEYREDREDSGTKKKKRKHIVFVTDSKKAKEFNVATHFDTVPELADRAFNRPRISTILKQASQTQTEDEAQQQQLTEKQLLKERKRAKKMAKKIAKARVSAYKELDARTKRKDALQLAEAHLITEKLCHAKGRKRKIKEAEDGKPAVYKWRRKRAT